MILYLGKVILGSGLLWLFYRYHLQEVRMFRFNRAYLLLALVVAYVAPLIPLHPAEVAEVQLALPDWNESQLILTESEATVPSWDLMEVVILVSLMISAVLALRLGKNVYTLWRKSRLGRREAFGEAALIYLPQAVVPHSFGRYIYLSETEREQIEPSLLTHELAHVQQRHSWDLLFAELLIVASWFNPFLYLYRRSIRLNHEFLADEAVILQHNNRTTYPYLILQRASGQQPMALSSAFHYANLKQRFIMMQQGSSRTSILLRQSSTVAILLAFVVVFAGQALGQDRPPPPPPKPAKKEQTPPPPPPPPTTKAPNKQQVPPPPPPKKKVNYDAPGYQNPNVYTVITNEAGEKVKLYWKDMTPEQKQQYLPPPPPMPAKKIPSTEQFAAWEDASEYGICLDGKQIPNGDLQNNFEANDIAFYMVSRLQKNAKYYGQYTYQLNAYTKAGYAQFIKNWEENWGD
ncbi:MAG: M56 family metallopeptidase [Bacteroidota bacterium]